MMRYIGAALLVGGCGGFGLSLTSACRREKTMLRQLMNALQEMEWELKFRITELPDLCRIAGAAAGGRLKHIFLELAGKLDAGEVTDISGSFNAILNRSELPRRVRKHLAQLGRSLGRFDLEGQLQGLQAVRMQCRKDLQVLEEQGPEQLRCCRTLLLCAGAALAILFL